MTNRHTFDAELSGLIDWADDALDALDTADTERARRALQAIRAWLLARMPAGVGE